MVIQIILCVLGAGILYYLVFSQGAFNSMIMAAICLVSALTAINYHEYISPLLYRIHLGDFGPKGMALIGLFAATLAILRVVFDKVIPGKMEFPISLERFIGSFFAMIAALTILGMVALALQSIPVPTVIYGYDRCPDLENPQADKNLFPYADNFVVSAMSRASNYCFSGKESFTQHHPEFLREIYLNRLVPPDHQGSRQEAPPGFFSVKKAWVVRNEIRHVTTDEPIQLMPGQSLIAVEVEIKPSFKKDTPGPQDIDNSIRFAVSHFRLVGFDPNKKNTPGLSIYPMGFIQPEEKTYTPVPLDGGQYCPSGKNAVSTLLFIWPADLKQITPEYIEFKRSDQAKMPDLNLKPAPANETTK